MDNIQIACSHSLIESDSAFHDIEDLTISLNRTILVSCGTEEKCTTYSCKGEYLYESGELVVFKMKTIIKSSLLGIRIEFKLFFFCNNNFVNPSEKIPKEIVHEGFGSVCSYGISKEP